MRFPPIALGIVSLLPAVSAASGADFTRADVESALAAAPESPRPSFAGRSLAGLDLHALDLHGVDFTSADLSGADLSDADLRGAKLVATKLIGAKLPRAKLNLAWIMRADFSHAAARICFWSRSLRQAHTQVAGLLHEGSDHALSSCGIHHFAGLKQSVRLRIC